MISYTVTGWRRHEFKLMPIQFSMVWDKIENSNDVLSLYEEADRLMQVKMSKMKSSVVFVDDVTVWKEGDVSIVKVKRP